MQKRITTLHITGSFRLLRQSAQELTAGLYKYAIILGIPLNHFWPLLPKGHIEPHPQCQSFGANLYKVPAKIIKRYSS